MGVETVTLGCRLNFAESEAMRALAGDQELMIVNSCAVTAEAVRQTRQAIRRAHRERPARPIVVTGCAAQLDPGSFAAMPEVARVVGNAEKYEVDSLKLPPVLSEVEGLPFSPEPEQEGQSFDRLRTSGLGVKLFVSDVMTAPVPPVAAGFLSRVRSFVAVQTGCDHRCTFCTIWRARGPSRSLPYAAVREAIERELGGGAREIVLTGVDVTSYEGGLGELCQRLLADIPALRRLRLSSLDSIEIDDALMELFGDARMMPHVHLSLQAGDDLILKRMKRRHLRRDAVRLVERLKARRPDLTIGADLIAGFPTESEDAAENSRRLIADCDIVAAHVFPFSARPDTPAARMPQVEREVVKRRAARLRETAVAHRGAWLDSLVGTRQPVLIENGAKGHSDHFAPVRIDGSVRGDMGAAQIIGRDRDHLIGTFE